MGLVIRQFDPSDEAVVVALWQRCGLVRPWNDPVKDIRLKLQAGAELFLVGVRDGEMIATVMAGYDGHRGWINYLAVDPQHRRRGYARAMMEEAQRRLLALGCPKVNLLVRRDNDEVLAFYHKLGYRQDEVVCLGKRLVSDAPQGSR